MPAECRLLVLDVDGVLTDGTFVLDGVSGESKAFHAADGFGLRLLLECGVGVAFLSGRVSPAVERRARELGITRLLQGRNDKRAALEELLGELGIDAAHAAYMGDDLVDLPAMSLAGFSAAPADARPDVRARADWVSTAPGGRGAVRELCEHLLVSLGRWEEIRRRYLG